VIAPWITASKYMANNLSACAGNDTVC
jgi:hypothetical protein